MSAIDPDLARDEMGFPCRLCHGRPGALYAWRPGALYCCCAAACGSDNCTGADLTRETPEEGQ